MINKQPQRQRAVTVDQRRKPALQQQRQERLPSLVGSSTEKLQE